MNSNIIKIIAVLILAIMMISIAMPTFAADGEENAISKIFSIFGKLFEFIINIFKSFFNSFSISASKSEITIGGTTQITAKNGTVQTYATSNSTIASIDKTGKVTGKSTGIVTITATSTEGKTATCTIQVISDGGSISYEAAMKFFAGVIASEAGGNSASAIEANQRGVGYVVINLMQGGKKTNNLIKALVKKNAFQTVSTKYSGESIVYNDTTYYTKKKATTQSLTTAKAVWNGTADNPIGTRNGFWSVDYYNKHSGELGSNHGPTKIIGDNIFFWWR